MNNPPEPALPTAEAAIEIKDDVVEKKVADGKEADDGNKKPKVDLGSYFVSASQPCNSACTQTNPCTSTNKKRELLQTC